MIRKSGNRFSERSCSNKKIGDEHDSTQLNHAPAALRAKFKTLLQFQEQDQRMGDFMTKIALASIVCAMVLMGSASAGDMVRVEPASSGRPYDYVVHVQNTFGIGYNPLVRQDRDRMALRALRGQCRAARIVGEDKITTEIWGITSSLPDYVVMVKCA
jgi:hypothetical protein